MGAIARFLLSFRSPMATGRTGLDIGKVFPDGAALVKTAEAKGGEKTANQRPRHLRHRACKGFDTAGLPRLQSALKAAVIQVLWLNASKEPFFTQGAHKMPGRLMVVVTMLGLAAAAVSGCQHEEALKHAGLGYVLLLDQEKVNEALQEFEEAVRLDDSLAIAYAKIGDIYREQGKGDMAVAPYKRAIELLPYEFEYRYNLGTVYQSLSRNEEAADTYEGATELRPRNVPTRINMSVCYFHLEQYDKALTHCEKAVELDPQQPFAWSNLGALYDVTGKPYAAIRAYKKALELDPEQAAVHINLGTLYLKQGRMNDALAALKRAVELDPDSSVAHRRLGVAYSTMNRYSVAIEEFQRCLELDSGDFRAMNSLAAIYMIFFLKDANQHELRQNAIDMWHRSLEVKPDQWAIKKKIKEWGMM